MPDEHSKRVQETIRVLKREMIQRQGAGSFLPLKAATTISLDPYSTSSAGVSVGPIGNDLQSIAARSGIHAQTHCRFDEAQKILMQHGLPHDDGFFHEVLLEGERLGQFVRKGRTFRIASDAPELPPLNENRKYRHRYDQDGWKPPDRYVGTKTVQYDPRFRKAGKNPAPSTIDRWVKRATKNGKPVEIVKAPDTGEIHYPEAWMLDQITRWDPRTP